MIDTAAFNHIPRVWFHQGKNGDNTVVHCNVKKICRMAQVEKRMGFI